MKFLYFLFIPISFILAIACRIVQMLYMFKLVSKITTVKYGVFSYSILSKLLCSFLNISIPKVDIKEGNFIVANHISWLDGFVFAATHKCTIVTKGELEQRFYIGFLLKSFGSISIVNDDIHSVLNAINTCNEYLDFGVSVLVFPEGTTGNQNTVEDFHSLFFEIPIKKNIPITVASLSYNSNFPCWIGGEPLHKNIYRVIKLAASDEIIPNIKISTISSSNYSRKDLAETARETVIKQLGIKPSLNMTHQCFAMFSNEKSSSLKVIEAILNEYLNDSNSNFGEVNLNSNFSELNLDSLGIVTLGVELERRLGKKIDLTIAYTHNTPFKLAMYLDGHHEKVNTNNGISGEVKIANTTEELRKIARFRYDIYVGEQNKKVFFADEQNRLLLEPVDAFNESVVIYTESKSEITSSIRVEYRVPDWLIRQLPIPPKGFTNLKSLFLARAVVSPNVRGSDLLMILSMWIKEKFNYTYEMALVTCTQELANFFVHYGFYVSEYEIEHPDAGVQKLLAIFTCSESRKHELSQWLKISHLTNAE